MKFKTTIKIVSEAEDRSEALEIVGEYLSGNLFSGIDMRCTTKPVDNRKRLILAVVVAALLLTTGIVSNMYLNTTRHFISNGAEMNAVQLPLNTSCPNTGEAASGFKQAWDVKQTKEALKSLKK